MLGIFMPFGAMVSPARLRAYCKKEERLHLEKVHSIVHEPTVPNIRTAKMSQDLSPGVAVLRPYQTVSQTLHQAIHRLKMSPSDIRA